MFDCICDGLVVSVVGLAILLFYGFVAICGGLVVSVVGWWYLRWFGGTCSGFLVSLLDL